jgi:tetratricopeptide (TPR) repeat protein
VGLRQLARDGKLKEAISYFTEAKAHDPSLFSTRTRSRKRGKSSRPIASVNEKDYAWKGIIPEALQEFDAAQKLYTDIGSAESWNSLCWYASLYGYASAVVDDACEKAVQLDRSNWAIRDSRGVARAIVGRLDEALEDFRYFVQQSSIPAQYKARRQRWIEQILQGTNPLTRPEEIEELKLE